MTLIAFRRFSWTGLALVAIQGLYQLRRRKEAVTAEQEDRLASLEARLVALERALSQTENRACEIGGFVEMAHRPVSSPLR